MFEAARDEASLVLVPGSVSLGLDLEYEPGRYRVTLVGQALVGEDLELAESLDLLGDGKHKARSFFLGLASELNDLSGVEVNVADADNVQAHGDDLALVGFVDDVVKLVR